MLHGLPRRTTAIAAGVLLLSGALSSCGFDYATNEVNTISSSINDQTGAIDVLGAAIISGTPDSGVLVATLSNTGATGTAGPDSADALTAVGGAVTATEEITPEPIEPLSVDNLYERGGIPVSGTFELGQFVEIELTFESGQVSTLEVPVVRPCDEYDPAKFPGMELPAPAAEGELAADETEATTQLEDPYSCEPYEPRPFGHSEEGEEAEGEEAAE